MLVAYIPALHKGYVDLIKAHGNVGLLGDDIIAQFTSLERDVRAVAPAIMRDVIAALGADVRILNEADLASLTDEVTMPDEDVMHALAERNGINATFVPTFLRWDKMAATATKTPTVARKVTADELDRAFMHTAIDEAAKSADWWRQVGAVIAKDGRIVAMGHNRHLPTDRHLAINGDPRSNFNAGERIDLSTAIHAEAGIIANAARDGIALNGASIYVSVFPCPNCARLIAEAGIKNIFYAQGYSLLDAEDILRAYGAELILVDLTKTHE